MTSKIDQSKKIKKTELEEKRTKAKQRELEKKGFDLQGIPEKFIPEGFETADPKTREKMIRMMKNRLSAQQSREKKKQKYQNTEQELQHYKDETERLQRELTEAQKLIEEMKKFIKSNMGIDYPTQKYDLSRSSSMKGFMKTGFLVLGLICVICLSVVNPGSTEPQGSIHTFPNPNNGPNSATTGPIYPSSSDTSK